MYTKATITIIDDDSEVRSSLTSLLRSAGYRVRPFDSAEAFLAGDIHDSACLLTDLHMPGMDGLELQAELHRLGCNIPVIVMTAFPTNDARARALDGGAVAFLAKPLDPDLLLDKLKPLTER